MRQEQIDYYKKWIWAYILLFIFEGALRKWFLPGLAGPLLLIREPIVLYLFFKCYRSNLIGIGEAKGLMIVGTICLFTTLIFGHHNVLIALYGWHIYFFHFPFIVIAARLLNWEDVVKIGKVLLYISIPMTLLVIMQFYQPQSAWVNRGVGGDISGAGFGGTMIGDVAYYRPPGTFSFTSGYTAFQSIVCSFVFYFMIANKSLPKQLQINQWILYLIMLCYMLSVPYSISRSLTLMTVLTALFALLALSGGKTKTLISLLLSIFGIIIIVFIANKFNLFGESINAFTKRFGEASEVEGGIQGTIGNRYILSFFNSLFMNVPIFGYGLGIGTNAGSSLIHGDMFSIFNAESGFGLIIGECGLLLGLVIIILRFKWTIRLVFQGWKQRKKNMLPILLMPNLITLLSLGGIGSVPSLGALVLASFLYVASLKINYRTPNGYKSNLLKVLHKNNKCNYWEA